MISLTRKLVKAIQSNKFEEVIKITPEHILAYTQVLKKLETIALHCKFHCEKIPQCHLILWCGNFVERHSFRNCPKLWGNCLSIKFPPHEIW